MKIFWFALVVTFIFNLIAQNRPTLVYNTVYKIKEYKANKGIVAFNYILLILIAGLRYGIGDTGTYKQIFTTIPANVMSYLSSNIVEDDRGFYLIVSFIKQFISQDNQVIIFIFSMLTIGLIGYGLYKYSDNIVMTTFLFITMGCYTVSMNGIRQYLATAILFLTLPLIKKRKFVLYLIIVLLTSTIHASAIIFIPIYFLDKVKGWGIVSYLLLLTGFFLFFTYNVTGPMIADFLGESQYGHYADALLSTNEGANIIRTLVCCVPLALSWAKKDIINQKMQYGNIVINLTILNFIFMLLASRYWIYARFCIYFNLYAILLLTYCIDNIFEKRSVKIITILCIICYCIFFWYDSLTSGLYYTSQFIKI